MSGGVHDPVRVARQRAVGQDAPPSYPVALRLVVISLVTAVAVAAAGGGDAFWLCLPGALLASASCRTVPGAAVSAAAVMACTAVTSLAWISGRALPPLWLVVLVPSASVSVLLIMRERLVRERDTLGDFALSDPLTQIANRRGLLAWADYEIARHTRARRSFALVMLDLDGFKLLNDRFGHAAGDDLLRDVATALRHSMRAQDTVARIGGDEFCVLAPETDEPGTNRLAARVANAVSEVTAGVETVHGSLGVAIFPVDGVNAAQLMHAADQRLLSAKRERRRGRARRRAA